MIQWAHARFADATRGAALVALAALLWSSSELFIKVLPLGALQIAFARSLVAAVCAPIALLGGLMILGTIAWYSLPRRRYARL